MLKNLPRRIFNFHILQRGVSTTTCSNVYHDYFRKSIENPEEFWDEKADNIKWFEKYTQVLDHSNPPFTKW